MKVGIWGWFQTGNYGDELMALYLAKSLTHLNVEPLVFSIRPELAKSHGICGTNDIDHFFDSIHFCLLAGGGFLIDEKESLNTVSPRFQKLGEAARLHGKRLYPFSVGGSGMGAKTKLRSGIAELWQKGLCGESILRLEQDVPLIESLGGKAIYLPDMLWDAPRLLGQSPLLKKSSKRLKLGINLVRKIADPEFTRFVSRNVPQNVEVYYFSVHSGNKPKGELFAEQESDTVRHFSHHDPLDLMNFLAGLDLVISSKLHAGLTALAQGTPFISCKGKLKAKRQMDLINPALVEDNEFVACERIFKNPSLVKQLGVPWRKIERFKRQARKHQRQLSRLVRRHQAGRIRQWFFSRT